MNNETPPFAELTRDRQEWIAATRKNKGFEQGIANLLTELYPDNAHFIYELLQNAEDTHAETARFTLSHEGVGFQHDGTRLFELRDVESITSIGDSTKRNDPTSIGKFGVGFKAVFAYTSTPEIHSGEYHFKIRDLVVPEPLPKAEGAGVTRFYFPFNQPKKDPARAVQEIERGLCALADNTLLFLNHIRVIEYVLPGGKSGTLQRVDADSQGSGERIEIRAAKPSKSETVSHWLRYRQEAVVTDEDGEAKTCQVAVAFHLESLTSDLEPGHEDEKKGKSKVGKPKAEWRIVSCEPGQVSIFFPAEKETSNLRFHLHAPFASTVARDSVRDCEPNRRLRDALARLVTEALADIRDRGLLTVHFLAVLPNPEDGLPPFYGPIREAIVAAFWELDLLPAKSGEYLQAGASYWGPADISTVIDDNDLGLLSGYSPPLWAANAPQRGQREDKFLDSLKIEKWSWDELKTTIQKTRRDVEFKAEVEKWLTAKPDSWLLQFYALMEDCHEKTSYSADPTPLEPAWKSLLAVRVLDRDDTVTHLHPRGAFFPPAADVKGGSPPREAPATVRFVKPDVYEKGRAGESTKKKARDFLERVGVRSYDERAEIERRLETYPKPAGKIEADYYSDVRSFIVYVKKHPSQAEMFRGRRFLLGSRDPQNGWSWISPGDTFLDDPYETTGLGGLIAIHQKWTLWPHYLETPRSGRSAGRHRCFSQGDWGVFAGLSVCEFKNWENNRTDQLYARASHGPIPAAMSIGEIQGLTEVPSRESKRGRQPPASGQRCSKAGQEWWQLLEYTAQSAICSGSNQSSSQNW